MESIRCERNWLAIFGIIQQKNFKACLINIYNPCNLEERARVWDQISEFWSPVNLSCLILGDFNEVLHPNERGINIVSQKGIEDFKMFIQNTQMSEIPSRNGCFTWFCGSSKSKLDHLLINPKWISKFPFLQVYILRSSISDHCPLVVKSNAKIWVPKPFRFQNCWLMHPCCLKITKDAWEQNSDCSSWRNSKMWRLK